MRTSTRVRRARRRDAEPERAPSRTPAGTRRLHLVRRRDFADAAAGGAPLRPRFRRGRRSGDRSAAAARRAARSRPRTPPAGSRRSPPTARPPAPPPKNESRMRSSTLETDGKSMATSSESQSARPSAPLPRQRCASYERRRVRIAQHVVGARHSENAAPRSSPEMSGMIAARQLPVRPLDLVGACVRRNAENVVVVPHAAARSKPCRKRVPLTAHDRSRQGSDRSADARSTNC